MDTATLDSLKDALSLYQTQYQATDTLWAYFSTVSLALLGFSIGSERLNSLWEAVVVLGAYLIFCVGNSAALFAAQAQLAGFATLAHNTAEKQGVQLFSLYPLGVEDVRRFYWAVVAAICIAVVLVVVRRQRAMARTRTAEATAGG